MRNFYSICATHYLHTEHRTQIEKEIRMIKNRRLLAPMETPTTAIAQNDLCR